jgi:ArsR family transcriptional regulator
MIQTAPDLFDRLTALADPTRSRMLLVLERHELTVSELCAVLQLPQSTASRHLKTLGDEGWVVSRSEGTSRLYTMAPARLDASGRRLWDAVREPLATSPSAAHDDGRLRSVLAARRAKSQEFFSTAAGQWDRVRTELFGGRTDLVALLALLDDGWTVGDLGCGTGSLSATLAPFVRRVVAVDASAPMLDAARERLGSLVVPPNGAGSRSSRGVELRQGELEALPIADAELDAAILSLVLHYVPDPARAIAEAARVVRPGGRVLAVDMLPHTRDEYRQTMGHVWQGFTREQMERWLGDAGLVRVRVQALPADPQAKGPTLFVATARVPS